MTDNENMTPSAGKETPGNAPEGTGSGETKNMVPPEAGHATFAPPPEYLPLQKKREALLEALHHFIIGQDEMMDLILIGLLSNGHILLEGVPGVAKTLCAKLMAKAISADFSRIQFTPDLMPSDVIGTSIYNDKESSFHFRQGPVFSNMVLIDEINRAPAKTQAALFEVMEERQITFDGSCYPMGFPFIVLATQNPVEQEGTYRLPEAQLDRFLFRIKIDYPKLEEEKQIIERYKGLIGMPPVDEMPAILSPDDISECQKLVAGVKVEEQLVNYIAQIVHSTRHHGKLFLGASPRASLALLVTAKAAAAIRGRDFITPDDVQFVANPVLNHRLILSPEAEMEGLNPEDIIADILAKTEVPR